MFGGWRSRPLDRLPSHDLMYERMMGDTGRKVCRKGSRTGLDSSTPRICVFRRMTHNRNGIQTTSLRPYGDHDATIVLISFQMHTCAPKSGYNPTLTPVSRGWDNAGAHGYLQEVPWCYKGPGWHSKEVLQQKKDSVKLEPEL